MGLRAGLGLLWVVGAAALGCGSSAAEEAPLTLETACHALSQAECSAFQRCSPEHFSSRFASLDSCVLLRAGDCATRRAAPGSTVTPEQVRACAATRGAGCEQVLREQFGVNLPADPACVWQGTLPDGEACIDSSQCAAGTCSFFSNGGCGTCLTRADDSCFVGSECLPGSRCSAGLCVVAGKKGEACGQDQPCQPQLFCRASQCEELGEVGAPCGTADSGPCLADLFCNRVSGLCEHSTLASPDSSCGVQESGTNLLCPAGAQCRPDAESGSMRCVPSGLEGELCTADADCSPGLGCAEGSCVPLRADRCTASATLPSATYPARLPSVPQAVAGVFSAVLSAPRAVLVSFAGDSAVAPLAPFVEALGSSTYWAAATAEYGVAALTTAPPIVVNERPPSELTDAEIQTWLLDKLAHDARFPKNDGSTVYVVLYPPNVRISFPLSASDTGHSCVDFGGYHSSAVTEDGTNTPYAVLPQCAYASLTTTTAHELVEAATDPYPPSLSLTSAGYYSVDTPHYVWAMTAGGGELADLCDWQPWGAYRDAELGAAVARSWSNAAMARFHQPCVPARSATAYFNSVPRLDNSVTLRDAVGSRHTRGVSIRVGESRTVLVDLLSDAPTDGPWRVSAYDLDQFRSHGHTEPTLRFGFDKQSGVNGDMLEMTITVLKQDPNYLAEPFVLVSRRGHDTNVWLGVVGQP